MKGKCPVFPEGPLSALFVVFRLLELVAIFCDFESVCETPPTVKAEHLFSKMKAQAETRAVLQNSLFFRFFSFSDQYI